MIPERGSATLVAMLVCVILTALGIAFVLAAEMENKIAGNERRSTQARLVAESGARAVKAWFDDPAG
ncbi:MAG: pilus assembly PilX N-terminal domain-containing protein, partial [Acidobacteriota bacterium]|nr:pilus assembly PilX N-terminal domain-containing protein [Acidobacteriota bacterium]